MSYSIKVGIFSLGLGPPILHVLGLSDTFVDKRYSIVDGGDDRGKCAACHYRSSHAYSCEPNAHKCTLPFRTSRYFSHCFRLTRVPSRSKTPRAWALTTRSNCRLILFEPRDLFMRLDYRPNFVLNNDPRGAGFNSHKRQNYPPSWKRLSYVEFAWDWSLTKQGSCLLKFSNKYPPNCFH